MATFNNDVLTMAAGAAGLTQVLTDDEIGRLNGLGDRLRDRLNAFSAERELRFCATGHGSLVGLHFTPGPVRNEGDLPRRRRCAPSFICTCSSAASRTDARLHRALASTRRGRRRRLRRSGRGVCDPLTARASKGPGRSAALATAALEPDHASGWKAVSAAWRATKRDLRLPASSPRRTSGSSDGTGFGTVGEVDAFLRQSAARAPRPLPFARWVSSGRKRRISSRGPVRESVYEWFLLVLTPAQMPRPWQSRGIAGRSP